MYDKIAKLLTLGIKKETNFFVLLSTFRNFAIKMAKLLRLGIKKIKIFCSALDFS